jgi:hypothetical protein
VHHPHERYAEKPTSPELAESAGEAHLGTDDHIRLVLSYGTKQGPLAVQITQLKLSSPAYRV